MAFSFLVKTLKNSVKNWELFEPKEQESSTMLVSKTLIAKSPMKMTFKIYQITQELFYKSEYLFFFATCHAKFPALCQSN